MRFHILGIPHTISTPEYSSCAFTQKVVKLCRMLMSEGHHVIHYGHDNSMVDCDEHVTITNYDMLQQSYPGHDWRKDGWPHFAQTDPVYGEFYRAAIVAIAKRKQPNDFLLCSFGDYHKPVADAHPDMIVVEPGIGYPNGAFAKFRVYESYAIMHAYQGAQAAASASNEFWYDAVIPNAFDLKQFEFSPNKQPYMLFLGRVNAGKGIHIARQIAEATRIPLMVSGQGQVEETDLVSYVGVSGPDMRKALMRDARVTICASTFLEPFCGVQIESMISGTPVISSDWGAFAEYNLHGVTGYRCKTFEQFTWAATHANRLSPYACRDWGARFSLEAIAPRYTEYFQSVLDVHKGKGWYEENIFRSDLNATSNMVFPPVRGA